MFFFFFNQIQSIDPNEFQILTSLVGIDIRYNKKVSIDKNNFYCLNFLNKVCVHGNLLNTSNPNDLYYICRFTNI